MLSLVFLLFL
ncbi:hypothetical protein CAEBREN_07580 [Caenorhabditis brenneri]|uniref:Uncharacterized protein n=1 Tax=Caenorhabditis brenneri TaxID=135651 RepID=G0M7E8_CAEBE|nr:hypothetical protein CAEBREN_07580 [Caenorhabditis brenneri]